MADNSETSLIDALGKSLFNSDHAGSPPQWEDVPRRFADHFAKLRSNTLSTIQASLNDPVFPKKGGNNVEDDADDDGTGKKESSEETVRKEAYMDGYLQGFLDGINSGDDQNGSKNQEDWPEDFWNGGDIQLEVGFDDKKKNDKIVGFSQSKPPKIPRLESTTTECLQSSSTDQIPTLTKPNILESDFQFHGHFFKYTTDGSFRMDGKTKLIFSSSSSTGDCSVHSIIDKFGRTYHVIRQEGTVVTVLPRKGVEWEQFKIVFSDQGQLEIVVPE